MTAQEHVIYKLALKGYGLEKQMVKCVEELSELQKELCKYILGQGNLEHITEEIANVEIMLDQMKMGLGIGTYEVDAVKCQKMCRLSGNLLNVEKERPLQEAAECQKCLYSFMHEEDLVKLGSDPCDTCNDLRNWKPKGAKV